MLHFQSLSAGNRTLVFDRPQIMGIVNVTPDSFYEHSRCPHAEQAFDRACEMVEEGADIIDIGGESTRPGRVNKLSVQEELDRVMPVVEAVCGKLDVLVSVDTSAPEVMQAAINAGVHIINDVRALVVPGALDIIAASKVAVVLMHSLIEHPPANFQPHYEDLLSEVTTYLHARIAACSESGITSDRIVIDPGFGAGMFGKSCAQNFYMQKQLAVFRQLACPILVGVSRKSFLSKVVDKPPSGLLSASLAATTLLLERGANIIRTHEVAEVHDVVAITTAFLKANAND